MKEDVRKESAIEINAQLSAENLQEKGNEFSAKHLTNRNVLKDNGLLDIDFLKRLGK